MTENVKNKDAEAAKSPDPTTEELNKGLEDTFPASDPVSTTRTPLTKKDGDQQS